MKKICSTLLLLAVLRTTAIAGDTTFHYVIPDTLKAIQYMASIRTSFPANAASGVSGIETSLVKLYVSSDKKSRGIIFQFADSAAVIRTGEDVKRKDHRMTWKYDWENDKPVKLLLSVANDSAGNFVIYSAYAWLEQSGKWKFIGTCKYLNHWSTLTKPGVFNMSKNRTTSPLTVEEAWVQRSNGTWRELNQKSLPNPVINLYGHLDSARVADKEMQHLRKLYKDNKNISESGSVFFEHLKPGTGRQVKVTDTVTVYYKGYLLEDESIFDQTKDKPATFPLNRLIRGWQIGVPQMNVGGKIRIIIPSGLAYSIRTRSPKIPPNSILVFEIEVVDVK